MYKLFVSEGIVLSKRGAGEANTLVTILTRELGLIRASARSARRENSKLRYGLELLTSAKFSFIRGKYEWKLTGGLNQSHDLLAADPQARQSSARVAKLILRLIPGEETNHDLYDTVKEGLSALARGVDVEAILVLRILSRLGYIPETAELKPFIEKDLFSVELAQEVAASRAVLIKAINQSLEATGL